MPKHVIRVRQNARVIVWLLAILIPLVSCVPQVFAQDNKGDQEKDQPKSTVREGNGREKNSRFGRIPSLHRDIVRLIDKDLAGQSPKYKRAVEKVFARQVAFCDGTGKVDRVRVRWLAGDNGEVNVTLYSPGRYNEGDTHANAITLRDGAVVGLTFSVESAIDSCPCLSDEYADYLDDDFLETLAAIDTLESIDLSYSDITDAGLKSLAQLTHLRSLILQGTDITCDGLQHLGTLQKLEVLQHSFKSRSGKVVGKSSVRRLDARACQLAARHPRLRELTLASVDINTEGVGALATSPMLKRLSLRGTLLEADAFQSLDKNDRLDWISMSVTYDGKDPIRLYGLSKLKHLHLRVIGAHVDVSLSDLPHLHKLTLSAVRPRARTENADKRPIDAAKAGRAPRLSLEGLAALKSAYFTLDDQWFGPTIPHGVVRIKDLPSLTSLSFGKFNGVLNVQGHFPNVKSLRAYRPENPTTLYQAIPHFSNLETIMMHGPRESKHGLHPPVTTEEIAPLFDRTQLKNVHITGVKDGELTFDPFRKLPHLKELTLQQCKTADPFIASGHPTLERLVFRYASPRQIIVRDMPQLSAFVVTGADKFESATLIECPLLKMCWCTQTPSIAKVDLRNANVRSPEDLKTVSSRDGVWLLPEQP